MNETQIKTEIDKLETAKSNVQYLLDNGNSLVDMHGLKYWAGVVERLRENIKKNL